jgi:hypothetical protein
VSLIVSDSSTYKENLQAVLSLALAFFRGSLYDAATAAYGQVCAPFHSWAIRKAVGAGMYTLPSREQLIERLNETGKQIRKLLSLNFRVLEMEYL